MKLKCLKKILLLICSIPILGSCSFLSFKESKNVSVLVIAVDSLNESDFTCNESNEISRPNLKYFCQESVRFTHAFTTSALASPALASILTAKYPFEHGLWHNGSQFLSAQNTLVSEKAVQKGVRTILISGGPPIWRKQGLSQGFEFFEDNVSLSPSHFYRNFKSNYDIFLRWKKNHLSKETFLSVIYHPDINFSQHPTYTKNNRQREVSVEGQKEAMLDGLEYLFSEMRKEKIWNTTMIVFVGLKGRNEPGLNDEGKPYEMSLSQIQTALFIKPPKKKNKEEKFWKYDENVSLVDIGQTLFDIYDSNKKNNSLFEAISLMPVLKGESVKKKQRPLLVESAWPSWRRVGHSRFILIQDSYMVYHDKKPIGFNIWGDRYLLAPFELSSIPSKSLIDNFEKFNQQLGFDPFVKVNEKSIVRFKILSQLTKDEESINENSILNYIKNNKSDKELKNLVFLKALDSKNWDFLLKISALYLEPSWQLLANANIEPKKRLEFESSCLRLLYTDLDYQEIKNDFRLCSSRLFRLFAAWIKSREDQQENKKILIDFLKVYQDELKVEKLQKINYSKEMPWDIRENSRGFYLVKLVLAHPTYSKYISVIDKQIDFLNSYSSR